MNRRYPLRTALFALGLLVLASAAHAATFDFIWGDRIDVTTYPGNVGFTLAGADFGLVVNKGATDISGAEFFATTFSASSSNPSVSIHPFVNNPGPPITPILPNQALGSVYAGVNDVLTTRLLPGETFHNTTDYQVIAMEVGYPPGFSGSSVFDITMTMGGNQARYSILMNFTQGSSFAILFRTANRVSSVPLATAATVTSWGAIKKLYH